MLAQRLGLAAVGKTTPAAKSTRAKIPASGAAKPHSMGTPLAPSAPRAGNVGCGSARGGLLAAASAAGFGDPGVLPLCGFVGVQGFWPGAAVPPGAVVRLPLGASLRCPGVRAPSFFYLPLTVSRGGQGLWRACRPRPRKR